MNSLDTNKDVKISDLEELEIETFQLESIEELGVSAPNVYTSSTSSTTCSVSV